MLSGGQEAAVAQVLTGLTGELADAWITVSSNSSLFNGSVRAAVLKNLDADRLRIERLGGELLAQVRAGTLAFVSWAEIATTTREDIAYQVHDASSWSLSGILWGAVSETSRDVVGGASGALASVGGGTGIGIILGVLLVVAIAVKFK